MIHWILSLVTFLIDILFTLIFWVLVLRLLLFFLPREKYVLVRVLDRLAEKPLALMRSWLHSLRMPWDLSKAAPLLLLAASFLCTRYISPALFQLSSYF